MSNAKRTRKDLNSITDRHYRRLIQVENMKYCKQIVVPCMTNVTENCNNYDDAKKSLSYYDEIVINSSDDKYVENVIVPTVPCEVHVDNCLVSESDESISANAQFAQLEHRDDLDDTTKLKRFLTEWSLTNHITHTALSALLQELKSHQCFSKLPMDARTLLNTPLQYIVKTIEPGEYIHFGLCNGIKESILENKTLTSTIIEVAINIDGLPLSKSSTDSFWPILGSIVPYGKVFIIGVYYGKEKPKNVNEFLHDFVSETIELYTNGIEINNSQYLFKIKYFVCDAPAKSYILQCRGHTGYYSCTKCTVEGVFKQNRMFP